MKDINVAMDSAIILFVIVISNQFCNKNGVNNILIRWMLIRTPNGCSVHILDGE
jgi:hypothetical protein